MFRTAHRVQERGRHVHSGALLRPYPKYGLEVGVVHPRQNGQGARRGRPTNVGFVPIANQDQGNAEPAGREVYDALVGKPLRIHRLLVGGDARNGGSKPLSRSQSRYAGGWTTFRLSSWPIRCLSASSWYRSRPN